MFRHLGKARTIEHNLKIASLLSLVAGLVNVTGLFAIQKLTTNVTGHFAYFVDEIFRLNFWKGFVYFLYVFFFFMGSFVSGMLTELFSQKDDRFIYILPASLECLILSSIGMFGQYLIAHLPSVVALSLLFAMGLQNSMVTTLSNAIVRTTHLTGLFTDLGIELSQILFRGDREAIDTLKSSVRLRLTIISFFFLGGIIGGFLYANFKMHSLVIASMILLVGIIYDGIKYRFILLKRKLKK